MPVQFTLHALLDTPFILFQMLPERTQGMQAHSQWSVFSATQIGTVHISVRFIFEHKTVGHILPASLLSLPLDMFHIIHSTFHTLGHIQNPQLLTLFACQRNLCFFLSGKSFVDMKAFRSITVATDVVFKFQLTQCQNSFHT